MSTSRNYSKESRSFYSRSSSTNNAKRNFDEIRPLSSRLVDRDVSSSSLEKNFDDRSFFDRRTKQILDDFERRRRKFFHSSFDDLINDEEFFKSDFGRDSSNFTSGRNIPVNYRGKTDFSSSRTTRTIPVEYLPSSTNNREQNLTKTNWNQQRNPRGEIFAFFL